MKLKIARSIFHNILGKITTGTLRINYLNKNRTCEFGDTGSLPKAEMNIRDESLIYDIVTQGEFALGIGYVNGKWDSPSMYHVLLVFMLNEEIFRKSIGFLSKLDFGALALKRSIKRRTANTIENCRNEIGITYDIGNDFYRLMLGPSMCYTCAIWPHPGATLEQAQEHKLKLIKEKAKIRKGHRVLDIGCGWGTLCNYINKKTGATTKGIALSREQISWCREKYPRLDFEYCDYREVEGEYDAIVSVGMAEHVGTPYWNTFMEKVGGLLKPGGRFVLHTMIYHGNDLFKTDGKNKYLNFSSVLMPNADSPTPSMIVKAAMNTGSLRLIHYETFGIHYTRTAQEWLKNMEKNRSKILEKFPEKLYKAHEYSWHMGQACMETGTSLIQVVFQKEPYGSPLIHAIL